MTAVWSSTAITELFGCRYPLQAAAMGGLGTPDLAVAVAGAGGIGMPPGTGGVAGTHLRPVGHAPVQLGVHQRGDVDPVDHDVAHLAGDLDADELDATHAAPVEAGAAEGGAPEVDPLEARSAEVLLAEPGHDPHATRHAAAMTSPVGPWPEETIPILRVTDADVAVRWYERLGFEEEWRHRYEPGFPAFVSVRRGGDGPGVRLFLSEHRGDAVPGATVYLRVDDVAPIAAEFAVDVEDAVSRLEVRLTDPDGNRLSIGARTGRPAEGYTYNGRG